MKASQAMALAVGVQDPITSAKSAKTCPTYDVTHKY